MTTRYYNLIGTKEYAAMHHVSVRAAQRAIAHMPGAVKSTGNKWVAPILSTQYAKAFGVSEKTARRRGEKASTPTEATKTVKGTLRERAAIAYYKLMASTPTGKPVSFSTIHTRMIHANRKQLAKIETLSAPENPFDDEWIGDDTHSVLFYH